MLAVSDCELAKSDFVFASLAACQDSTPKAPKRMAVTAPRTCKNQMNGFRKALLLFYCNHAMSARDVERCITRST